WQILIEPSKYPLSENDLLFSKRLESVRKDVECFFGILKGRFRILKLAMAYQSQERIDNVFFTCCILHNMLHTFDTAWTSWWRTRTGLAVLGWGPRWRRSRRRTVDLSGRRTSTTSLNWRSGTRCASDSSPRASRTARSTRRTLS
ncbi:unnamed protein product, partial [Ectocarpus fasciculatus]